MIRCECNTHGITIEKDEGLWYIEFWILPQWTKNIWCRLKTSWKILLNRSALIDCIVLEEKEVKELIKELDK